MAYKKSSKSVKKTTKRLLEAFVHVNVTYNNVIVTVTDVHGNTYVSASAGSCGYKNAKKPSPHAFVTVATYVGAEMKKLGVQSVECIIKGIGANGDIFVNTLASPPSSANITVIRNITPIPFNGVRPPGRRRT